MREGFARKKKTKKTQQTQYIETDEHPVQSQTISNGWDAIIRIRLVQKANGMELHQTISHMVNIVVVQLEKLMDRFTEKQIDNSSAGYRKE